MYLKLHSDASLEIPDLRFNPALLDEVLCDCGVHRFEQLAVLGEALRNKLVEQIWFRAIVELNRERSESGTRAQGGSVSGEVVGVTHTAAFWQTLMMN